MVYRGGLENRWGCKPPGGSNPSPSATRLNRNQFGASLLKSEAAVLLHRRLLDGTHLALEIGKFIGVGAVAFIREDDRPEQNDIHGSFDHVVLAGLVLLTSCFSGAL